MGLESVGHVALAAVFGSAAVSKARALGRFTEYLENPFRRWAKCVATAVIVCEMALAMGLLVDSDRRGVLGGAALCLVAVSLFIAWRLVVLDETECGCWGLKQRAKQRAGSRPNADRGDVWVNAVRPAWYAF